MQFWIVTAERSMYIAPPRLSLGTLDTVLRRNTQSMNVGDESDAYTAAPRSAVLRMNAQLRTVGLPLVMYIPPPKSIDAPSPEVTPPLVIVNPSRIAVELVLLPTTT